MKTRNFLFTSLLALASTVAANAQTFDIDLLKAQPVYSAEKGQGYDIVAAPKAKSNAPFFYSVKVADGNYAVCVTPGAITRTQVVRPYFFVLNAPFGGTPSVSVLAAGSTQPQAITLSEMPVSPCGIFADPLNGHIFVLSYKMGDKGTPDYNGNGYVVEYDSAGQKQHEYETGVGSCAMFFDSAYKTAYAE